MPRETEYIYTHDPFEGIDLDAFWDDTDLILGWVRHPSNIDTEKQRVMGHKVMIWTTYRAETEYTYARKVDVIYIDPGCQCEKCTYKGNLNLYIPNKQYFY